MKNTKILKLPRQYKNQAMGYLPLDFDDKVFKEFVSKINSIHPYARLIVEYAMFYWKRESDVQVINNVTTNFFEGDYSNVFFHKNLETIIRELRFTFTEGRTRNIVPVWLYLYMNDSTYASMKETRVSNDGTLSSSVIDKNSSQLSQLTNFSLSDMTFDRANSIFPISDITSYNDKYFPDGTRFDGTQSHIDRMIKLIPHTPYRRKSQITLLPNLKVFDNGGNSFMDLVFNDDSKDEGVINSKNPELTNPSRFIKDLITIYAFYKKGTMNFTNPIVNDFPLAMWENIDMFNREVYSASFKTGSGDQTEVKKNTYINEMVNDTRNAIVNNTSVVQGSGRKITYSPTLSRATLKPYNFILIILEQAKDLMKWLETEQFEIIIRSKFDQSKTMSNDSFIANQLHFMNSMADTVQNKLIEDKNKWQNEKDALEKEYQAKKTQLEQAILDKKNAIGKLEQTRQGKQQLIENHITELEKRYIVQ